MRLGTSFFKKYKNPKKNEDMTVVFKKKINIYSRDTKPPFNFSGTWASAVLKQLEYLWLAKHLIFYPVSICQQWKQPWAQPCGIGTENKCITPSAFGKDYLPLSSCNKVHPNSPPFHSSGWEKHIPVEKLSARTTVLLLFKGCFSRSSGTYEYF